MLSLVNNSVVLMAQQVHKHFYHGWSKKMSVMQTYSCLFLAKRYKYETTVDKVCFKILPGEKDL